MSVSAVWQWSLSCNANVCVHTDGECEDSSIQISGGPQSVEGCVEVCLHGRWGAVCDDGWDFYEARVVCKQLGFSAGEKSGGGIGMMYIYNRYLHHLLLHK